MRGKQTPVLQSGWSLEREQAYRPRAAVAMARPCVPSTGAGAPARRFAGRLARPRSPTTWASECSASSRGNCVSLPAQSRNELLKPCVVNGDAMRRNNISNAMPDSGRPAPLAGKNVNRPSTPRFHVAQDGDSARSDNGTGCRRAAFIPLCGNRPNLRLEINLVPARGQRLAGTRRRQNAKLEGLRRYGGTRAQASNESGNVGIGHSRMVAARQLGRASATACPNGRASAQGLLSLRPICPRALAASSTASMRPPKARRRFRRPRPQGLEGWKTPLQCLSRRRASRVSASNSA